MSTRSEGVSLRSLLGAVAPTDLVDDWRKFLQASAKLHQHLWDLLPVLIYASDTEGSDKQLEDLCISHSVSFEEARTSLKPVVYLIQEASRADLSTAEFALDIELLSSDRPDVRESVLSGYEATRTALRDEAIRKSIVQHGQLMVGMDWRIDHIEASNNGYHLNTTVMVLTMTYITSNASHAITLYVLPQMLETLRASLTRMIEWNQPQAFRFDRREK